MPQTRVRISPAGMVARGALFTYLTPRLAQDAKLPNLTKLTKGVTSRNYSRSIPGLDRAIRQAVRGRLARDADISDLADLLNALRPGMEQADQMPMQTPMQGGGAPVAPGGGGDGDNQGRNPDHQHAQFLQIAHDLFFIQDIDGAHAEADDDRQDEQHIKFLTTIHLQQDDFGNGKNISHSL